MIYSAPGGVPVIGAFIVGGKVTTRFPD